MKTYIIKNHLKSTLISELLKDQQSLFGTKIISLDEFLSEIVDFKPLDLLTKIDNYSKLDIKQLASSLKESSFIAELQSNRLKLDAYQTEIDDLLIHEEYKTLLKHTETIDYRLIDNYLNNHQFDDFFIVECNYSLYEERIIKKLLAKGAKTYHFKQVEHHDYAVKVNIDSDAIDGICQYIISNHLDLNDTAIIANSDLFNFIDIHTKRYNLATNYSSDIISSNKARIFIALVEYHLNPSIDNYLKLVSLQLIKHHDLNAFIEYFKHHVSKVEYHTYNNLHQLVNHDDSNFDYYHKLEDKANHIHEDYIPIIQKLNELTDFKEVIVYAFSLIATKDKESLKIKKIIEKYADNLVKAYPYMKAEILKLKYSKEYTNAILVSSFNKEVYNKPYLFVINPNIKIYPGFKMMSGFLNEEAIAKSNYPSLKLRYDNHMSHFNYLNQSAYTFYFLENSTLDGKALEYDKYFKNLEVYPIDIISNDNRFNNYRHQISEANAHNIFFKQNNLHGSISRFERYFNCPYSYFLNYGLGLYEANKRELSAALTGTMIHAVFEHLFNEYGSDYYKQELSVINDLLRTDINELKQLYPNNHEEIDTILSRIIDSIAIELLFIEDMEANTDYRPKHAEYAFKDMHFLKHNGHDLVLRGIIDRVDENCGSFRIVDYKTSKHSLSKKEIAKGLQLQLLTYVYIYQILSGEEAVAAYYLNVAHSKLDTEHYKFSKRTGIERVEIDEDFLIKKFLDSHKMQGYAFKDAEGLDFTYSHVNTRSKKYLSKDSLIDYDNTLALLKEIYINLIDNLDKGNIELTPHEKACEYCKYHSICHFKGLKDLRNEAISDIDITLGDKDETE